MLFLQQTYLILQRAPYRHLMSVICQKPCERNAPASGSDHTNLCHVSFFPPRKRLLILPRLYPEPLCSFSKDMFCAPYRIPDV